MAVREEAAHHLEAFELYYALGEDRSLEDTAEVLGRSLHTIRDWCKIFNWKARVRQRDHEVMEVVRAQANEDLAALITERRRKVQGYLERLDRLIEEAEPTADMVVTVDKLLAVMGKYKELAELELKLSGIEDQGQDGRAVTVLFQVIQNLSVEDQIGLFTAMAGGNGPGDGPGRGRLIEATDVEGPLPDGDTGEE